MSKTYKIPITYQSVMTLSVEADTLEEAVEKGLREFLAIPDENYICDSFEVDEILRDDYPDEDYNINKVKQKL